MLDTLTGSALLTLDPRDRLAPTIPDERGIVD